VAEVRLLKIENYSNGVTLKFSKNIHSNLQVRVRSPKEWRLAGSSGDSYEGGKGWESGEIATIEKAWGEFGIRQLAAPFTIEFLQTDDEAVIKTYSEASVPA
jgi:hypothetical protein